MPNTLWAVVLLGSILTLLPLAALPASATTRSALVVLAVALGLVFHFVAAMDRPFLGTERVTPDSIEDALNNMQRWDTRMAAAAAGLSSAVTATATANCRGGCRCGSPGLPWR